MQLCLLGPLEVVRAGAVQRLPGRGERALLALLGLAAGRTVAAPSLIEALWPGDQLPEDPLNALQLRVSKLRRALAAMGEPPILGRHGAGYRLDLDPADVDALRFEALINRARRTGEPGLAADRYHEALNLWRGDPLIDFAGDAWTLIDVGRLTELRFAAAAELAERTLSLGRYEQTVSDLEPFVAAAPTRERLAAQLMTALFNAGRQAEALEVYARTRAVLVDELGLDPSRELRTVMEQILHQDPRMAPAAATPTNAPRMPFAVDDDEAGPAAKAGNLPLRSTSFVGRDTEVAAARALLRSSRLVTLVGPGGAGKTALAIEVARATAGEFRDGSWLVRLASVNERTLLPHAMADELGLTIEGGTAKRSPVDVLVAQLSQRDTLVVLDNCEHLVDAVASVAEAVLARCPDVRILATSREALAIPGEVQLPVAPLAVPEVDTSSDRIADFPSARLFLDRAAAVTSPLPDDHETMAAVALICRRLDGIPLALELAAARLSSLEPRELAERVLDRFGVLTSGARTADARQQTLRATVDWSHDLLSDVGRRLFRRLAVFRGGWTLAAAEAVVGGPDLPEAIVLDELDRLVRQSLVEVERQTRPTRYRMLETLRQYAEDSLVRAGEFDSVAATHAAHFVALGEQAEEGLRGPTQARWVRALGDEHANLRAALAWMTTSGGQSDGALRLAGSLGLYWHMGRHLEGREVLQRVMARPGGSPAARARALQAVSLVERPRACLVHPSEQCAAAALESLEVFEAEGDRPRAALSRLLLAVEGVGANPRVDGGRLLDQADSEFAQLGDDWGRAVASFVRMEMLFKRGDRRGASAEAERATDLFRHLGDGWGLSAALYHYGLGVQRFGSHADAVPLLEQAIEVAAAAGVYNTVQWAAADLGLSLLALGRVEEAAARFTEAGAVSDQVGDHAGRLLGTYADALVALQNGEYAHARPIFDAARAGFSRLGVSLATGLALAGMAACAEQSGDAAGAAAEFAALLELGEQSGETGLIATALEGLGRAAAQSDPTKAAEFLQRAVSLRERYDPPTEA